MLFNVLFFRSRWFSEYQEGDAWFLVKNNMFDMVLYHQICDQKYKTNINLTSLLAFFTINSLEASLIEII